MIKKPVTIHIKLSYQQSLILLNQLQNQIDRVQYKDRDTEPEDDEMKSFQRYRKEQEEKF
jgi:hypothetical protein